jgi:hypothetical protein
MLAPASYLGNYLLLGGEAQFEWDARVDGTRNGFDNLVIEMEGPGGKAVFTNAPVPSHDWEHYSAPIMESQWEVINGNWNDLLENVTSINLEADFHTGDGADGAIDNFALIPEPTSISLLALASLALMIKRKR